MFLNHKICFIFATLLCVFVTISESKRHWKPTNYKWHMFPKGTGHGDKSHLGNHLESRNHNANSETSLNQSPRQKRLIYVPNIYQKSASDFKPTGLLEPHQNYRKSKSQDESDSTGLNQEGHNSDFESLFFSDNFDSKASRYVPSQIINSDQDTDHQGRSSISSGPVSAAYSNKILFGRSKDVPREVNLEKISANKNELEEVLETMKSRKNSISLNKESEVDDISKADHYPNTAHPSLKDLYAFFKELDEHYNSEPSKLVEGS